MYTSFDATGKVLRFVTWRASRELVTWISLLKQYMKDMLSIASAICTVLFVIQFLLEDARLQNLPLKFGNYFCWVI